MMLAMRSDVVDNIMRNPAGLLRAGQLARTADLRTELADLRERGLPVLALSTDGDGVIPASAFAALCSAIGTDGAVLPGRHSWLLSDPDTFGEVLGNVVDVRMTGHREHYRVTRATQIIEALGATTFPLKTVRALLNDAPPLWLRSAPAGVLAADLALCHPKLRRREVRAVARPSVGSGSARITVVAADRRGLLSDTSAVLVRHGLSITEASAATWPKAKMALHSLTVNGADGVTADDWARIGTDLHRPVGWEPPAPGRFAARVSVYGAGGDHSLVRVTAPDRDGLFLAISRWFADHDVSIEAVDASTTNGIAHDVFLVAGTFGAGDLIRHFAVAARPQGARWPARTLSLLNGSTPRS
jgi:predicted amino acid-binding ACT domain protein